MLNYTAVILATRQKNGTIPISVTRRKQRKFSGRFWFLACKDLKQILIVYKEKATGSKADLVL